MIRYIVTVLACAFSLSPGFSSDLNISASYQSSYTRMADGTVKSWGKNGIDGRLGINVSEDEQCFDYPTNVIWLHDGAVLSNVVAVAGGRQHALALLSDGTVVSWGNGGSGQLGTGNYGPYASKYAATNMLNITNAMAISAGNGFSMILLSNNVVYGCGDNSYGQLGVTITSNASRVPLEISGLSNIVKIAAGTMHCLALDSNKTLWAWGDGANGKLGNNQTGDTNVPVAVLSNVVTMAAAVSHSLAVTEDGRVWAWGSGFDGRLGTGNDDDSWVPVLVSDASYDEVILVPNGTDITTTTNTTGTSSSSGSTCQTNFLYQTVTTEICTNYISVTNTYTLQSNVVAVAAGRHFSLALDGNGRVWSWGSHSYGQLGTGGSSTGNTTTPVPVRNVADTGYLTDVVEIAAAKYQNGGEATSIHSMARQADGTVLTWGDNSSGQLGVTNTTESTLPVAVPLP